MLKTKKWFAEGCRDVTLENGSRDIHTLGMVGGPTREDQPPSQGRLQVRQVLQDGCHRLEYPGHRTQERDDLPNCKPSRFAHTDIPRGADPAFRSPTAPKGAELLREPHCHYGSPSIIVTTKIKTTERFISDAQPPELTSQKRTLPFGHQTAGYGRLR